METFAEENKENFWGVGPLFGLEADLQIGCGFSLYASASVSWLYGKFHIKLAALDDSELFVNFCESKNHLDGILGNAGAEIGIQWQQCLCGNMNLILQLGLEHQRYFDYNRIGRYGDLSFDGVNFSAGIEF